VVEGRRAEFGNRPDVLRAAYKLCLKYGKLKEAFRLCEHFRPTKDEVLELVYSVKRALQLNPFAMNSKLHFEWLNILRTLWLSLSDSSKCEASETLMFHEILLGRYPTIVRSIHRDDARALALRLYNRLEDSELRDAMDVGARAFRQGPAVATVAEMQTVLRRSSTSALGIPVWISLAKLGKDALSLIAVAAGRDVVSKQITIPGVFDAVEEAESAIQLATLRSDRGRSEIAWPDELGLLCREIVSLAQEASPSCAWVMLATEPEFASIPWNGLGSSRIAPVMLLSLMPSFSWAVTAKQTYDPSEGVNFRFSDDPDLVNARLRIEVDREPLKMSLGSVSVVLGHGKRTAEGIPSIAVEGGTVLTLHDWLDLSARRVLVVHSCHSGRVDRSFPSDLGGLPGFALAAGCHSVLAPVTSVPLVGALTLHEELARWTGAQEIGLRYIAALRRDPAVALYNLYGFANETAQRIRS
jgi:hypothetical protein